MIPPLVHVAAGGTAAWRVHALLRMNAEDSIHPGPGSDFVIPRLMELLFVELLRERGPGQTEPATGLLAGLADPVTARALHALHGRVAHAWTVAALAREAGVSRSTFAERFRSVIGTGPMQYLQQWRMALAKDALLRGTQSVSEIAFAIGFQSASAFSTAFSKSTGMSPRRFAEGMRGRSAVRAAEERHEEPNTETAL